MQKQNEKKEQLKALLRKGLNAKMAARAAGCSLRKVYYVKREMLSDGVCTFAKKGVPIEKKCNLNLNSDSVFYRVHDMTLSLPIHYASKSFKRRLKKGNMGLVRGNRVQLFPSRVVLRGAPKLSFDASSHADALDAAMVYWEGVVRVVEQRWGLVIWKRDSVFGFTFETAEVNNGLASELVSRREFVRIRDEDTGKTWALVDASTGAPEFEATDAVRAGDDMERVLVPFFNDLRRHADKLMAPSEVQLVQADILEKHLRLVGEVSRVEKQVAELVSLERMRLAGALVARDVPFSPPPDDSFFDYVG
jgi:hypothetical protein